MRGEEAQSQSHRWPWLQARRTHGRTDSHPSRAWGGGLFSSVSGQGLHPYSEAPGAPSSPSSEGKWGRGRCGPWDGSPGSGCPQIAEAQVGPVRRHENPLRAFFVSIHWDVSPPFLPTREQKTKRMDVSRALLSPPGSFGRSCSCASGRGWDLRPQRLGLASGLAPETASVPCLETQILQNLQ